MEGDLPRHVCVTIHPSSPHHHLSLIRVTGSAGAHPKVRNTPRTPSPKKHLSSIQNENQKKVVLCYAVILEAVHFDTYQRRHVSSLAEWRGEQLCSHT